MSITINENDIIISNISNYNIEYENGNMILKKRKKNKSNFDLTEDYTKSVIKTCYIENKKYDYSSYNSIIKHLFKLSDADFIKNKSTLNIVSGKKTDKGYKYLEELDISYQGVSTNKAIQEIVSLTKLTSTPIKLVIELANKKLVTYEN